MRSYLEKLHRADQHFDDLNTRIKAFIDSKPYVFVPEEDPHTRTKSFRMEVRADPPPVLSLIIGDWLHNTRSALDHLAFALAQKNAGASPASEGDCQFPICSSAASFNGANTQNRIRDIHPAARAVIEGLQPYAGGNVQMDSLWVLHGLSIIDKHRLPVLTGGVGLGSQYLVQTFDGPRPGIDRGGVAYIGPFKQGTEIFRIEVPPQLRSITRMQVQLQLTYVISFEQMGPAPGSPVLGALQTIRDHVRKVVIPKLEPFL